MNEIPLASSRQLTAWRKLGRKKVRQEAGLFLAEGERCVEQILSVGRLDVEAILLSEASEWRPADENPDCYRLSKKDFESIVDTESPQGVAAVCRMTASATTETLSVGSGLLVAMDAIQDPGNLGTMVRSAVWFGVSGILCGKGTVDLYHPKVVRSTAGVTGLLPASTGTLATELKKLESAGWRVLLLDAGPGASPLQHLQLPDRTVLVVGNEGNGIDTSLFDGERQRVAIEGDRDRLESLNAAVALSIVLYEWSR